MKRYIILFSIALIIFLGAVGSLMVFGNYSEGFRAGKVMKLSKKGLLFKTWEGQLDLGGLYHAEGAATTIWNFSIVDETLIDSLYQAMETGKRTRLHYRQKFYTFPWQGKTDYFIDKVELVK